MTDWARAACIGRPDLPWTTDYDVLCVLGANEEMISVCESCPLLVECVREGVGQVAGFWAGTYRDAPAEVSLGSEPVKGRTAHGAQQVVLVFS